jgi:hypothetical protein
MHPAFIACQSAELRNSCSTTEYGLKYIDLGGDLQSVEPLFALLIRRGPETKDCGLHGVGGAHWKRTLEVWRTRSCSLQVSIARR